MTEEAPRHVVVGRLRRPHGLKGETTLFPLTDSPDVIFAPGRTVMVLDLAGQVVGGPLEIERSRAYHREWLVKFRGIERREELEPYRAQFLGTDPELVPPPADDEVYLHELEGFAVRLEDETPVGLVSGMYELPQGLMLTVQGPKREFLLPYKKEFVRAVDRAGRRLIVVLPEGMLDL